MTTKGLLDFVKGNFPFLIIGGVILFLVLVAVFWKFSDKSSDQTSSSSTQSSSAASTPTAAQSQVTPSPSPVQTDQQQAGPTDQPPSSAEADPRVYDTGSGLVLYYGDTFQLGSLTLGSLKSYCAHVSAIQLEWRLATADDLQPVLPVLIRQTGVWSDLTSTPLGLPGYILVTATAQEGIAYASDRHSFSVDVYRLISSFVDGRINLATASFGLGTVSVEGPDLDSAFLTDGSGNSASVKVICVANGH